MSLPRPLEKYDLRWATELTRTLEAQWTQTHRRGTDVELGLNERVIVRSPDGNRWAITVDNAGAIVTTAL